MTTEKMSECNHQNKENIFYCNSSNEDGWRCSCGKELGFKPDLDKELIYGKINGLLSDLHENKFIHVSNGTQGEFIVMNVLNECEKQDRYDQLFIIQQILSESNIDVKGHSDYWRNESKIIGEKLK
jgi:hypothetical protein